MTDYARGMVFGALVAMALFGLQYGVGPAKFLHQFWAAERAP
jgi:hypothetical protein